jgi:chromosome segregation ATPase
LGSAAEELRSSYEKAVQDWRVSLQQCSALERSLEQMQALLAEKEEQVKRLSDTGEQLRLQLAQKTKQVDDWLVSITRLQQ